MLVQVHLHGKCQMQWGDRQYYVALQQVRAYGCPVPASQVQAFTRHMQLSPLVQLPGGGMLPAPAVYSPQQKDAVQLKSVTVFQEQAHHDAAQRLEGAAGTTQGSQRSVRRLFHGKGLVKA